MVPGWFFSRSVASAASSPTDMLWLGCLCAARMMAMVRLRSLLWKAPCSALAPPAAWGYVPVHSHSHSGPRTLSTRLAVRTGERPLGTQYQ